MSSSLAKRKLDDYYAADDSVLFAVNPPPPASRMRKDQNTLPLPTSLPSRSSLPESTCSSAPRIQFFVRIFSDHTRVLCFDCNSTVKDIHEKIESITGIPVFEQRLIYRGKQLRWEQTVAECNIQNDALLELVGRMRSTEYPQAWQLVNEIIFLIFRLYKDGSTPHMPTLQPPKTVKSLLVEFLSMLPLTDLHKASGHFRIFLTSSVPSALVMLYMSSHQPNREAASEAVKQFIESSKNVLPKNMYCYCAPIVLEFCKLLRETVGTSDSLYNLCRSTMAFMVDFLEIGLKEESVGVHDIFPFVNQLAAKLSQDLGLSMESSSFVGPLLSDVRDFTAFVVPVRKKIMVEIGFCGPLKTPLSEQNCMCYGKEITVLLKIFVDLLGKMEKCLLKIEDHMRAKSDSQTLFFGWCQYLAILRELNSISKLYEGAEVVFWEKMRQRKDALCYLIVTFAKRSDDHQWILEHKEVTNFEARKHLAMMILPEVKDEYDEQHEMLIDRSQLLAESFEYIAHADLDSLRAGLFMEFKNEEATGPGVLREWFFLVCQAIFNPQNALFLACPNDRRRFFPNPASKVDPLHLEYFNFSGRVIALALMHKVQVGIVFDRVFFLQLAGLAISLEDIRDADPSLYNSCKQILEMDPVAVDQDALGLTFAHEVEELGSRKIIELCPAGSSIVVNSKNRKQYVDSLIQHYFVTSVADQVANFAQGFAEIMSSPRLQRSFFESLYPEDFDLMLYGSENAISVEDWKAHTEYHGYKETDLQISWFWKIVGRMTAEQRKVLLFFWTSIKYLPVEGFGGLASRLYIYKTSESFDRLPSSHTCFYRLCFPAYPSIAAMRDRLRVITQEHVGCSFGTW